MPSHLLLLELCVRFPIPGCSHTGCFPVWNILPQAGHLSQSFPDFSARLKYPHLLKDFPAYPPSHFHIQVRFLYHTPIATVQFLRDSSQFGTINSIICWFDCCQKTVGRALIMLFMIFPEPRTHLASRCAQETSEGMCERSVNGWARSGHRGPGWVHRQCPCQCLVE